jgi:hypothetical protein
MFALLIAVGALFLAVVAISAVIDPWQSGAHDADEGVPTTGGISL